MICVEPGPVGRYCPMPMLIGTSGWQYRDWRGGLYPEGVPQRLWLEHYATRYRTVENNNSFYRLPSRETFAAWRERTPGAVSYTHLTLPTICSV